MPSRVASILAIGVSLALVTSHALTWFWVKHDDLRTAFTGAGPRVR